MSGNTYGKLFTVTTAGESHGPALVAIVDGCPPGLEISLEDLQRDLDYPRVYAHFLTTLRAEFPFIVLYRPDYGPAARHLNSFVVAGAKPLPTPAGVEMQHVPSRHSDTLAAMLRAPRPLDQQLLESGRVITDSRNTVTDDLAASQLIHRRNVLQALPAAFLLN